MNFCHILIWPVYILIYTSEQYNIRKSDCIYQIVYLEIIMIFPYSIMPHIQRVDFACMWPSMWSYNERIVLIYDIMNIYISDICVTISTHDDIYQNVIVNHLAELC